MMVKDNPGSPMRFPTEVLPAASMESTLLILQEKSDIIMAILSKEEAKSILKKVIAYSKAEECEVSLNGTEGGNIRYARNSVSTSGDISTLTLGVTSIYGKKSGTATINEFDDASLQKVVRRSEELAQLASVIKMDVDWLRIKVPDLPDAVKTRVEHASVVTGLLINTIRRINFSISPVMLEETGLNATLKWHCREFSVLNGIPCYFESNYEETDLSLEIQTDFFRICQEALSNIMYHAEAKNVWVSIKDVNNHISLSVMDDGNGFIVKKQTQSPGLTSMRKRANSINSELIIDSIPGKGTTISVTLAKSS